MQTTTTTETTDEPGRGIALRWYGLMYIVGFALGYYLLVRLARRGRLAVEPPYVGELVGWMALGVIVGGRIGYLLFYSPSSFLRPLEIFMLWEGGLSFHGGLVGVVLLLWWFARRHGTTFLALADGIVLAAPPGIAAVRISNFINGELYGRLASETVPWAMRFPSDPVARRLLGIQSSLPQDVYETVKSARASGLWAQIEPQIPLRHPSQLYEAATEGLLLFLLLWAIVALARRYQWPLRQGFIGGVFLIGYALARSIVENYRQPDAQFVGPGDPLGTVLGPLTMGQVLSLGLLIGGIVILFIIYRRGAPTDTAFPSRSNIPWEPEEAA
jgi:phosphatidylglycerol:prolipoprotein diacylglycerol transferase